MGGIMYKGGLTPRSTEVRPRSAPAAAAAAAAPPRRRCPPPLPDRGGGGDTDFT